MEPSQQTEPPIVIYDGLSGEVRCLTEQWLTDGLSASESSSSLR